MVDAVMTFALITALGEFILLHHLGVGFRAWLLSHQSPRFLLHCSFAALNLWIHWGTMTGSMTAVTAFVVSVAVCKAASLIYLRRAT